MKEPVPHKCITCKYYEPYHCVLTDGYIGHLYCQEPTKCIAWRLREDYKKANGMMTDRKTGRPVGGDGDDKRDLQSAGRDRPERA